MENVLDKAIIFAVKAHEGQTRKDGSAYILHPLEVAVIAGTMTNNPDVLAAAVLHDTVEDTPVTAEDILDNFGPKVAELVAHETEDKRPEMKASESWKIRKEESLAVLKDCPIDSKILWVSDKLSNMRSLYRDYEINGLKVFEKFNEKNPSEQRWYHESVLKYTDELSDFPAYKEYKKLFELIFNNII